MLHLMLMKTIYSFYFIHSLCGKAVHDTFAPVSGSTAPYSLVSGRMFYSSPGSRWLTVHDLQHWMINGKKAHFIHRPAYLSAAHWYSCWKCGERHSWMYGCGLHWKWFDIELSRSTATLLRSDLLFWCSQMEVQVSKTTSWSDKMLSTEISSLCNVLIVGWWEASAAFFSVCLVGLGDME